MYFKEIGMWNVDWSDLIQDRNKWWDFVSTAMNITVPCNAVDP